MLFDNHHEPPTFRAVTKDSIKVVVGEHDLEKFGDEQEYHDVEEIIIHPEFDLSNFESDFAIIKLVKQATLSEKVAVINLPNENMTDLTGKMSILFGWGQGKNESYSVRLKTINMEVMTNLICSNFFDVSKINVTLTKNHICALRRRKGSATCRGDSGGKNSTLNLFVSSKCISQLHPRRAYLH
jgi:hypothetical protein